MVTDTLVHAPRRRAWPAILLRVAVVLLVAVGVGSALNHVSTALERSSRPAGFSRGLLQGALMPMSLPNLLVGHDVTIYSLHNTGLAYKLGYTAGVNACGALFFGLVFWRLSRWTRQRKPGPVAQSNDPSRRVEESLQKQGKP